MSGVMAVMKPVLRLIAVLAFVSIFLGMSQDATSREMDMRKVMGSNFAHLQKILVDLIRSDYSQVPGDVTVIEQHAVDLVKNIPGTIKQDHEVFRALADSLQTNAKNLRVVASLLADHDKKQNAPGVLNVDYLRNTAGAHFGQMVTTCVACHNLFRRNIAMQ